jgi:hypothetical protein
MSATASLGVVGPAARVSDCSPVVGEGARLAGGTEEKEAMDKVKNHIYIYIYIIYIYIYLFIYLMKKKE